MGTENICPLSGLKLSKKQVGLTLKPVLPLTRYVPRRIDDRADAAHVFTTPEAYYRVLFLAMLDAASISLQQIFESETWDFLSKAESALLVKEASTTVFSDFYKRDLNPERVPLHIDMLHDLIEQKGLKITSLSDLVSHLKADDTTRLLLPELLHAIRLILTVSLTT